MYYIFSGKLPHKLLLLIVILTLMTVGCGSSGEDDPYNCPGDPRCKDTPTNTDTDTPIETDTDTPTDTDADFAIQPGTYHIYEERKPPCALGATGYFEYNISVAQEPGSNVATIMIGNMVLNCSAVNASKTIYCEGRVVDDEGWTLDYSRFELTQYENTGIDGDTELQVSRESTGSSSCETTSIITSNEPEDGSVAIVNISENYTVNFVSFESCGSDGYGSSEPNSVINPSYYRYYTKDPGCYDIYVCDDQEPTSESVCIYWDNIEVERAKTTLIPVNSINEELYIYHPEDLLPDDRIKFTHAQPMLPDF